MCQLNNANIDAIPPEVLFAQNVWTNHPISERLIECLFDFMEERFYITGINDNGLLISDSGAFVDIDDLPEDSEGSYGFD